ncbi:MFS general substrate transporter [Cubamyces menziesii]|nr:MFS general substrate transporter [Cubamyces menziesii]
MDSDKRSSKEEYLPGYTSSAPTDCNDAAAALRARRVLRKLDLRILPLISTFFVLSFLDRTNIGNAKIAGLPAALHLTGLQYNLCSAIFFIPYCFFEVPSNIALKRFSPSKWIPTLMICWSAVMISMAFVKNFGGLLTARVFLGVTEAGLFPGATFYLCMWYPRAYQAQRVAIMSGSSSIAGAFGGLLAFAIEKLNGVGGLAGWSWIFLLEGLLTAVIALLAYVIMQDYPERATFLTEDERAWLVDTLKTDNAGLSKELKWKFISQALCDPRSYLMVALFLFTIIPSYAFILFLPTIISGLGFSASRAQLLSVPPNIAGAFFTILAGILADRWRARGAFILVGLIFPLVGYAVLYATSSPGAGYAGTIIAACGIYPAVACIVSWTGANFAGEAKRAVVLAMVIGFGNLGGIASSFIYRPQDSPRYHPGHATCIACLCLS